MKVKTGRTKTPEMHMDFVKNEVEYGKGAKLQRGNRASPELDSKGIKAGKQPHVRMIKNGLDDGERVPAGMPPRGPAANRSRIWNGSTDRGQSQARGLDAKGGVGSPARFLGLDDGAMRNTKFHGNSGSGTKGNRFDLYSAARGKASRHDGATGWDGVEGKGGLDRDGVRDGRRGIKK